MLHRLILKVTKFQLPPPTRLGTVVKNILGGPSCPPPMSNRIKGSVIFYQEGGLLKIGGDQVLCLRSKGGIKIFFHIKKGGITYIFYRIKYFVKHSWNSC